MKSQASSWPNIIAIFLMLLVVIYVIDIIGVFTHPSEYPFGSEFFSVHSIYRSRSLYISYQTVSALLLVATIFFVLKRKWKLFGVLFFLDLLLFFYPILTNT